MTDKKKYKSVAIDHDCYKKIEELAISLNPGVTLSRAQVVKRLVHQRLPDKKNVNETIVSLFSEHTPFERQKILRDIDSKMLLLLDLNQEDIPWLCNSNNFSEKWMSIMDDLRLIVAKFKYEQCQNEKSIN